MTITEKFWELMRPLCLSLNGVQYAKLSDGDRMDRFRADAVSQDVYPGIFTIRPKYKVGDNQNGHLMVHFDVVQYVLCHLDQTEYEVGDEQDAAIDRTYDQAEELATAIQRRLRHWNDDLLDSDEAATFAERMIEFDPNSWQAEPVSYVTLDNAWGYEIRYKLAIPAHDVFC